MLGYAGWRNFTMVVDKALGACEAAGEAVADLLVGSNNMVVIFSHTILLMPARIFRTDREALTLMAAVLEVQFFGRS